VRDRGGRCRSGGMPTVMPSASSKP
jgi:hypothetical protein